MTSFLEMIRRRLGLIVSLATTLALAGLAAQLWLSTKRGQALLQTPNPLTAQRACRYGAIPTDCPAEHVCAFVAPERSECVKRFVGSTPFVMFPFDPKDKVVCTQGPQGPAGSNHSHETMLFGLDLATQADAPAGTVYSAFDGTAVVYRSCPDGKDESCGNELGNHVRVINPHHGLMVLYAHMGSVWVQDGQVVKAGEALGREGKSGRAGYRHLHFSVHHIKIESWLETLYYYRKNIGALPPSVPFETQFCDPIRQDACVRRRERVENVPCLAKAPAPPKLEIVGPVLRADWRN